MAERITLSERIKLRQRIRQARMCGVPSVIANFSQLMTESADNLKPLVLVATGHVLAEAHREHASAFVSWHACPLISEVIANHWAKSFGTRDADHIMALAYSEMVGFSCVRDQSTQNDRDRARRKIIRILKQSPPSVNEMRAYIFEIIKRCKAVGNRAARANERAKFIPDGAEASQQTLVFYMLRGHTIPAAFFTEPYLRDAWTALADLDEDWVDLGDNVFEPDAEFGLKWAHMVDDTLLGYYEGKALQSLEKARGMLGGAMFCYLTALSRKRNVTQYWVHRRKREFQNRIPGINFDPYISEPIVKNFARMYTEDDAQWEDIYRQLVVYWSIFQATEGISLTWIFEQASYNNVTCLTTITDVVTKLQFFDVDFLIQKGIPRDDFRHAMIQARDLLRNPFCSVVKPTVHHRQYADLAYLCTYIKRNLLKDESFAGFRGQASAMCTRTEAKLRQIGAALFEISRKRTGVDLNLHGIYTPDDDVVEVRGDGEADQAEGGCQQRRRVNNELQQDRAGWPRQAWDLPARARLVDRDEMFNFLEQQSSPLAKAFKLVMNRMYAVQSQISLTGMPLNALNIPPPERSIAADVRDALLLWEIDVPEDWLAEVPAYIPEVIPCRARCRS